MTSEIRTNSLTSRAGLSTVTLTDSGPMFSGITTFVDNSGFNLGTGSSIFTPASNTLTFGTNSNERFRIDSDGRLIIGGGSSRAVGFEHRLQLEDTNDLPHSFSMISNRPNAFGVHLSFAKSRGSTRGSNSVVQDDDEIATLVFRGADGTDISTIGAMIDVRVDGTPASNKVPASFEFHTANSSGTLAKRLIINSAGHLMPAADSTYNIGSSSVRYANIYADNLYGDGSNLTGISAGTSLSGSTNNTVCTVTGANAIQGEANLTFNGSKLVNAGSQTLTAGTAPQYRLNASSSDSSDNDRAIFGLATATNHFINGSSSGDTILRTTNSGNLIFGVGTSEKLRIDSSGRVLIGTTTEGNAGSDDLTIATSGSTGITVRSGTSSNGNLYFSDGTSGDDEYRGSIQYQHANNALVIATDAVERLRIDSSGNALFTTNQVKLYNATDNSNTYFYTQNTGGGNAGIKMKNQDGEWTIIANDSLRFIDDDASTDRLRITSAGKLLVGVTSGSNHHISSGSDALNTVFQANLGGAGATCAIRVKMNTSANDGLQIQQNGSGTSIAGGAHAASIFNRENGKLRFGTNNTERLTIESNGHVYAQTQFTVKGELNMHSATTAAKYMDIGFQDNSFNMRRTNASDGGHSNFITVNASKVVSGNFNDTSDGKLKKNVATISDGAIEDIKKLRPVTFDWIDETENDNVSGFIAQEVKQVLPNLVDGTEYDPAYNDESLGSKGGIKSVGYSINSVGVTAHLTKAVQELIEKVEKLEQENIALRIRLTNLEDN